MCVCVCVCHSQNGEWHVLMSRGTVELCPTRDRVYPGVMKLKVSALCVCVLCVCVCVRARARTCLLCFRSTINH